MAWDIEYTDAFERWLNSLSLAEQDSVAATVGLLREPGPFLRFPFSSRIVNSEVSHMRELRIQHAGKPLRVLYAFDPRRVAILLVGGSKRGDDRWYARMIPIAEKLYHEHLSALSSED